MKSNNRKLSNKIEEFCKEIKRQGWIPSSILMNGNTHNYLLFEKGWEPISQLVYDNTPSIIKGYNFKGTSVVVDKFFDNGCFYICSHPSDDLRSKMLLQSKSTNRNDLTESLHTCKITKKMIDSLYPPVPGKEGKIWLFCRKSWRHNGKKWVVLKEDKTEKNWWVCDEYFGKKEKNIREKTLN